MNKNHTPSLARKIFVLISLISVSVSAIEFSDTGIKAIPRCLQTKLAKEYILFSWNKDLYDRNIYATKKKGDLQESEECSADETKFSKRKSGDDKNVLVSPDSDSVFDVSLPLELKNAFEQIRKGGNQLRSEEEITAIGYLQKHPIENFTVEKNRELTSKFGVGFTSEVYEAWINQNPKNSLFKERILTLFEKEKKGSLPTSLAEEFRGYTVAVVFGYGHIMNGNRRFRDMHQDLIEFGLDVKVIETDSFGEIDKNSVSVRDQLSTLLQEGRKVILVSGSKGSTEVMGAVSDLATATFTGKIEAVINLAGIVDGSFVVDWAASPIKWHFVKSNLFKQFNKQGAELKSPDEVESLKNLQTKYIREFYHAHPISANKAPVYLSIVGITSGNGLVKDSSIRTLQDTVERVHLAPKFGANDGYIEYPGTQIPDSAGLKTFTLAFEASHAILDGTLAGISMNEKSTRQTVLRSIFRALQESALQPR